MLPRKLEDEEIHLRDYIQVFRKRQWTIIAFFVIVVTTVTIGSFKMKPTYKSTTQLLIERENPNVVSFQEVLAADTAGTDYYQTEYKILKSRNLARMLIKELDLGHNPEFYKEPKKKEKIKPISASEKESRLINTFLGMLEIEPIRNTRLVNVNVIGRDPVLITNITNTLAKLYIEQNLQRKFSASMEAVTWLNGQIKELGQKVADSQKALQQYKERKSIVSLEEKQNIIVQRLAELSSIVTDARTKRIGLETRYNQLKDLSRGPEMIESLPSVIRNPLIQQLKVDYIKSQNELSELEKKYKARHPRIVRLKSRIAAMEEKIILEVRKIIASIETEYKVAKAEEKTLIETLEAQKKEALTLNKKAIQYGVLKREAETNAQMYNVLLTRMKETSITGGLNTSNIRVVDRAEVPKYPIKPKKKLNVLLAMIVGLVMGIGLAFFFEYLDNTIKTPEDVERYLNVPFLGSVGMFKVVEANPTSGELISHTQPKSNISEAIRNIRTNIVFSASDQPKKTLIITSSGPSEGKTIIASNLAITMAQAGKKILLVDTDMRKPRINKLFKLKRSPGISNVLIGEEDIDSVIKDVEIENLKVITCGPVPPNPSELLGSAHMVEFIKKASEKFDFVFLDSPPVMSVTDPLVLANKTDAVILVIKAGETPFDPIKRCCKHLEDVNASVMGVVLNNIDFRRERYYYSHYYHYYRKYYGKYYGEGEETVDS